MLKGINQWALAPGMSLEEMFALCSDAGFESFELTIGNKDSNGLKMESTTAEIEAIGALARKYGLQLRTLVSGLFLPFSLASTDSADRVKARQLIERQLEICDLLGIDTMLVVPGGVSKEVSYDQCYERTQEQIRLLANKAEQLKVHVGVENIWNKFLLSPLEMARYIDEINSPYVGVYFDVGNILQWGFPEQWLRILGKRVVKVHLKDFKNSVGNAHGATTLLSGDVDWAAVREALQEIGYNDSLTAELGYYAASPKQSIYDIARHIDVIIGRDPH